MKIEALFTYDFMSNNSFIIIYNFALNNKSIKFY